MQAPCPESSEMLFSHRPEVRTIDKVRFLRGSAAYAAEPTTVETIETHMSWVFLAGDLVYKLKKPVRFEFLDFRSLDSREHFVREEVRLNRRLAPGVYLGVSVLTLARDGALEIDGKGEVVDWLVRMHRLPSDRMLDQVVESGAVTPDMIDRVADILLQFYTRANRPEIAPGVRFEHFASQFREDAAVLLDPYFRFDGDRVAALLDRCEESLAEIEPELTVQAETQQLVDGHGDLRPEHVCLCDPPVIFDCIEFSPALRIVDPFEEIAFLGVECARLGAAWITPLLYARMSTGLPTAASPATMSFYWRARAMLRARLALAHLHDARPRTPEKWRPLAWTYIELAEQAESVTMALGPPRRRGDVGSPRRNTVRS